MAKSMLELKLMVFLIIAMPLLCKLLWHLMWTMKLDGCHQFLVEEDYFSLLEAAAKGVVAKEAAVKEEVAKEEVAKEVVAKEVVALEATAQEVVAAQEEVVAQVEVAKEEVIVAQLTMYHLPLKKKLIASFVIS